MNTWDRKVWLNARLTFQHNQGQPQVPPVLEIEVQILWCEIDGCAIYRYKGHIFGREDSVWALVFMVVKSKVVSSGHKCNRARSSIRAYTYLVIQTTCFLFTIRSLFTNHSQKLSSSIAWMLCSWSLSSTFMLSRRRRFRCRCRWFRLPFWFCIHVPVGISFLDSPLSYSPYLYHVDGNVSGEDKQEHA